MARRRHFAPDQDLVHVSFECVGDAFLMRPDAYTSFVIASALEQAARKFGVRVHAFCFLSNHAHQESSGAVVFPSATGQITPSRPRWTEQQRDAAAERGWNGAAEAPRAPGSPRRPTML